MCHGTTILSDPWRLKRSWYAAVLLSLMVCLGRAAGADEELKEIAVLKRTPGSLGSTKLQGRELLITALRFSADGSLLVGTGANYDSKHVVSEAVVWNVKKQKPVCVCREPQLVSAMFAGFSDAWLTADGRTVIAQNGVVGTIPGKISPRCVFYFFQGNSGKKLQTVPVPGLRLTAVAVSPDGMYLAIASNELEDSANANQVAFRIGDIEVWDVKARKLKWKLTGEKDKSPTTTRKGFVEQLAFSPDGSQLAVYGKDGLRIFLLQAGKQTLQLKASSDLSDLENPMRGSGTPHRGLRWSTDAILLHRGRSGSDLRDAETCGPRDNSELHNGGPGLVEVRLSPPDLTLWDTAKGGRIAAWKLPKAQFDFRENETIKDSQELQLAVALSADYSRVAVADTYGVVHVYELPAVELP